MNIPTFLYHRGALTPPPPQDNSSLPIDNSTTPTLPRPSPAPDIFLILQVAAIMRTSILELKKQYNINYKNKNCSN